MKSDKKFKWTRKDLLSLEELSKEEIELLLETAESFKEVSTRDVKKVPALRGKTVANLFFESSTRTRTSFEIATKRLSADIVNFSSQGSSTAKGESLKDTAARALPYFQSKVMADVKTGKNVIVSAHGNSLRAIVMHLDKLTKEQVLELNLATGLPIVYEFDSNLKILSKRELLG